MNQNQPLVSILLPVCNSAQYLTHCLKSLLSQSYKNIEIVAIDDYSKDESLTILKSYKKQDSRIRIYHNKKRYNLTICLNRALKRAKGSFIAFMNTSDIATSDRIKRQVNYLLSNPQAVVVGTQIGKNSFPTDHQTIIQSLLSCTSFQFETAMINKLLLPKDLLYFKQTSYPALFTDLFVKLLPYGKMANLPWVLQKQKHPKNISHNLSLSSLLKVWFASFTSYDYRLPLRSLFTPLLRQT